MLLPFGNGNVEYASNTCNLRRLHRKFDVEYTLVLRWKMVIRETDTLQLRIYVDSTSTFTLQIAKVYLSRRFCVEKYLCGYGLFFNVESTSILRWKVQCVNMVYSSTSIRRWKFPIYKACRFINVEYTSILRRCFPHGIRWCFPHGIRQFFDVECTPIWSRNFFINKASRFIDVYTTLMNRQALWIGNFKLWIDVEKYTMSAQILSDVESRSIRGESSTLAIAG